MYQHNAALQFIRSQVYYTRGRDELLPQSARLTLTQNSISVVGPVIWNTIPEEIKNSPSPNSFKFNYKKYLLSFYANNNIWLTHLFYNFFFYIFFHFNFHCCYVYMIFFRTQPLSWSLLFNLLMNCDIISHAPLNSCKPKILE